MPQILTSFRSPPPEDKRLERLYDYTKFHIGIYLTLGTATVTVFAASVKVVGPSITFGGIVGHPLFLVLGVVFVGVAGVAGGVIASSATQIKTFDDLWNGDLQAGILPLTRKGYQWVTIEHTAFWIGLFFIALSVLKGKGLYALFKGLSTPLGCLGL